MYELIYTSATQGLKPGSQGFCTVAHTQGMPPVLVMRLEALSAYRHLYTPHQSQTHKNPTVHSHAIVRIGETNWHVLTRISDAGVDYTQRPNKIAHHLVLNELELLEAGPAAILECDDLFARCWNDKPGLITKSPVLPPIKTFPALCKTWEQITGDAGWGGVLAATASGLQPASLIITPEMNVLALIKEAMTLLEPDQRWKIMFNTYYTKQPGIVNTCHWKCVIANTIEAAYVQNTQVFDLTKPMGLPVPTSWVKMARTGTEKNVFGSPQQPVMLKKSDILTLKPMSEDDLHDRDCTNSNNDAKSHGFPMPDEIAPLKNDFDEPELISLQYPDVFYDDDETYDNKVYDIDWKDNDSDTPRVMFSEKIKIWEKRGIIAFVGIFFFLLLTMPIILALLRDEKKPSQETIQERSQKNETLENVTNKTSDNVLDIDEDAGTGKTPDTQKNSTQKNDNQQDDTQHRIEIHAISPQNGIGDNALNFIDDVPIKIIPPPPLNSPIMKVSIIRNELWGLETWELVPLEETSTTPKISRLFQQCNENSSTLRLIVKHVNPVRTPSPVEFIVIDNEHAKLSGESQKIELQLRIGGDRLLTVGSFIVSPGKNGLVITDHQWVIETRIKETLEQVRPLYENNETSSETKLQLAPLREAMQKSNLSQPINISSINTPDFSFAELLTHTDQWEAIQHITITDHQQVQAKIDALQQLLAFYKKYCTKESVIGTDDLAMTFDYDLFLIMPDDTKMTVTLIQARIDK